MPRAETIDLKMQQDGVVYTSKKAPQTMNRKHTLKRSRQSPDLSINALGFSNSLAGRVGHEYCSTVEDIVTCVKMPSDEYLADP